MIHGETIAMFTDYSSSPCNVIIWFLICEEEDDSNVVFCVVCNGEEVFNI